MAIPDDLPASPQPCLQRGPAVPIAMPVCPARSAGLFSPRPGGGAKILTRGRPLRRPSPGCASRPAAPALHSPPRRRRPPEPLEWDRPATHDLAGLGSPRRRALAPRAASLAGWRPLSWRKDFWPGPPPAGLPAHLPGQSGPPRPASWMPARLHTRPPSCPAARPTCRAASQRPAHLPARSQPPCTPHRLPCCGNLPDGRQAPAALARAETWGTRHVLALLDLAGCRSGLALVLLLERVAHGLLAVPMGWGGACPGFSGS